MKSSTFAAATISNSMCKDGFPYSISRKGISWNLTFLSIFYILVGGKSCLLTCFLLFHGGNELEKLLTMQLRMRMFHACLHDHSGVPYISPADVAWRSARPCHCDPAARPPCAGGSRRWGTRQCSVQFCARGAARDETMIG